VRKLLRILILLLLPLLAEATHEVSGYISFKKISGTTYEVTVVTFTNGRPLTNPDPNDNGHCSVADRDTMRLYYGYNDIHGPVSELLIRTNGPTDGQGFPGGDSLCTCRKINIYKGSSSGHTFPGAGSYTMWTDDADRMDNITNMVGSGSYDFYLFTTLYIDPLAGNNVATPLITNPLTCDSACTGQCFYYNPGAYSPYGDSMSYSLGNCLVLGGVKAPTYTIPPGVSINPITGTLTWCNPAVQGGIYNFSIRINTYKHIVIPNQPPTWHISAIQDVELEINVSGQCFNNDPVITGTSDTCIIAGDVLKLNYIASAPGGKPITMSAAGQPDSATVPRATFTYTKGNPAKGTFIWQTNCAEVRKSPYNVTIKATNPGSPPLSSYFTTTIHVIGPAITGLTANVVGNSVNLSWQKSVCSEVIGYNIYRAVGCIKFIPGPCVTGVPPSSGYTYIGFSNTTSYTDNSAVPGLSYSYLVVGVYPLADGSLGIASNDTCVLIRRDIPLLTNVSVDSTSLNHGTIFTRWLKPKIDAADFDTNTYPGPYTYTLLRASGINGTNYAPLVTRTYPYFGSTTDTTYKDNGLDTQDSAYRYKLNFFFKDTVPIGSVPPASSIYLTTKPGNNTMNLTWTSNVPWTDSTYLIYRHGPVGLPFIFLATVPGNVHSYTDTNLTNKVNYCYYVKSRSFYSDSSILHPLFDSSEIQCNAPKDTIPPCAPHLVVAPQCNTYQDSLIWNNPDHTCPGIKNVIQYYNIYYTPTQGGDLHIIKTINNVNDTIFVNDSLTSIAGCYAVTAVDSFGNESALNTICVDNCPQYTLPNVFTPNGDNQNDFFTPILPYRYIQSIDINIFNRWGQVMFHTNNPMILWDGTDQHTHGKCPDGVYYYVCVVNEIRVTGIKPVTLKGFVQIIR